MDVWEIRGKVVVWFSALVVALFVSACGTSDDGAAGGGSGGFQEGETGNITAIPNPVTFGSVAVGTEAERKVSLLNSAPTGLLQANNIRVGTGTSEIRVCAQASPAACGAVPNASLGPGESMDFWVRYAPTDSNSDEAVILVDTNVLTVDGALVFEIPVQTVTEDGWLVGAPSPLDFGGIPGGTTEVRDLQLINPGSESLLLTGLWFDQGLGEDFAIVEGIQLPVEVSPSIPFGLQVSYSPTGGGADTGWLMAEANDGQDLYQVLVTGTETGPALAVFPDPVDFGWRAVGQVHSLPLNISNDGTLPLVISTMAWDAWSSPTLGLEGGPDAGGVTLEPGAVLSTTITFNPTSDMVPTTAPIGGVLIESNDASSGGALLVPVYGKAEVPVLQVNPPEMVDFAFVAQNNTASRTVNLYNAGSAPVEVYELLVEDNTTGEFALKLDETWGPTSSNPASGTVPAGAHQQVTVTFTNEGADSGTEWGKLRILSNDSQMPDWELSLKAQRAGSPICEVALVPGTLDFGIVPRGFSKTMAMSLVVNGSGNCSFHSVFANDCGSWGGFFGTSCDDPEEVIQMDGNSAYYTLSHQIPAIAGFLQPGDAFPIEVTFTPPDTAPIFGDEMTDYGGLLGVRVLDPADPGGTYEIFPKPQVGGGIGGGFAANLHAQSGLAELSVFPGDLDFGLTTIGCHSQTLTINAYNIGTAPLDLTNWELQGCSPEFKVKSWPGVPKTLQPQEGVQFEVVYVPQDEGGDSCGLALTTAASDTPAAVVPLSGGGTFEVHQIDEFIQSSGQDVDVLFVVDDSGSMGEEQNNLASNFLDFVNEAGTWSNHYHLGVTTTDLESTGGRLMGEPRYVQPTTPQAVSKFQSNVKVGTNGSGTEQGLAAAQIAVSLPNIADSNTACAVDTDCAEGEGCFDGFCGGPNRGFLRKDASLEVVFLSDEEDQSPADLDFYINFFKNLKGFFNENLFHAHAIVGPSGGCSSGAGDAAAGNRYIEVANATGGNVISICESNFAAGLASIGEIAFGLKVQFFLTRVADPPTIEVTVNGSPCSGVGGGTTNWTYDAPSNSVVFNENGGCMPQPGQTVVIEYDTICFLE